MKESKVLGLLVVALLGVGLFLYFRSEPVSPDNMTSFEMEIEDEPESVMTTKNEENVEQGDSTKDMVMEDSKALQGLLEDVSDGDSSGLAYLLRKDGLLYHYVEADLPTPKEGFVYEGWLVNKTPELKFFSTGVMTQEEGKFVLSYKADAEFLGFDEVVITLEEVVDDIPEKHVLEGKVE